MPKQPAPKKPPPAPAKERPTQIVMSAMEIGGFVSEIRRALHIRQADLAHRAQVSRQWVVALEQGKPTLDLGMVLRTLETMGFEVELKPYDPMPPWIVRAAQAAKRHRAEIELARNLRRRTRRRELAQAQRRSANARGVMLDLE